MLAQLGSLLKLKPKPDPDRLGGAPIRAAGTTSEHQGIGRRRHPREAPFTPARHYGEIQLRCRRTSSGPGDLGRPLVLNDLFAHTVVLGESGSGKTYYVLNQLLEGLFRSTHLPDGEDRQLRKVGGLIIEAKGDFTPKTWALAQRYGRMDDIVFFGPDHLNNSYDLFGDPTESATQLADKMIQLLAAFGGGKKSEDPFWDNSARKLFTHLFLLHRRLKQYQVPDLPPLSFELLNLLILDRGHAQNQSMVDADRLDWEQTYSSFLTEIRILRSRLRSVTLELNALAQRQDFMTDQSSPGALAPELPSADSGRSDSDWMTFLFGDSAGSAGLLGWAEGLQRALSGLTLAKTDAERGEHYQAFLQSIETFHAEIIPGWAERTTDPRVKASAELQQVGSDLRQLLDHLVQAQELGEKILDWVSPRPEWGRLRRLLQQYQAELQRQGMNPLEDPIWAYFQEEYLNTVNDRTSGSVGMVASNLVTLFIHWPFNRLFSAQPTFTMSEVVDRGQVVVLNMPLALYGAAATLAALILKIDYFRVMLSRSRRYREGGGILINQERPMFYFCDEFASVASTGETTGEAGFLDKVREYRCACILGLQSVPMLLKRFPESEVEAILTNCGNKIFLRNSDSRTNDLATKVLGQHLKANLTRGHTALEMAMNAEMPVGKEGFTTSYSLGNRVEPSEFPRLADGVAYLKLNPRFGDRQVQRLALAGNPLAPAPEPDPYPLPWERQDCPIPSTSGGGNV